MRHIEGRVTKREAAEACDAERARGCVECGLPRLERRIRCRGCHEGYSAAMRAANRAICAAIARGELPKAKTGECVDCGKQAMDWDHRDYSKPLEVERVCRACNGKRGPARWRTQEAA